MVAVRPGTGKSAATAEYIPTQTALRTGQSGVAVTSPLSPSHNGRPALTNSTRSVEPPKASLWSKDADDAAALQLLRPVSRPPQPLQLAHSQRASDEPPEAPASQSSSASYASPRLPCGVLPSPHLHSRTIECFECMS